MPKFTDSSYDILETYFNVVKTAVTFLQNSYLAGPMSGIWAEGGLLTTLYEKKEDGYFVGHRFRIVNILNDNDFIFRYYELLDDDISLATDLQVGNEMYFRKDSLFHDWLKVNSSEYEEHVNVDKTFLYFGKISSYPSSDTGTYYRIPFEGLKNYTRNILPVADREDKLLEWLKIFWDKTYQPVYNRLKTMWSMIDAKEIPFDFLAYISDDFGIEIDEGIDELLLREWVQNIIYYLKRKGTHTAYYAPWKLLLGNTENTLNVYERWQEWCSTNISNIPLPWFEDHHYLEYYGVQPSGAAGEVFYSRYNPDNYPTYADIAPTGACSRYYWKTEDYVNYSSFTEEDQFLKLSVAPSGVGITAFDNSFDNSYLIGSFSIGTSADFRHTFNAYLASASEGKGDASVALWGVGDFNGTKTLTAASAASGDNFLAITMDNNPPRFTIWESVSGTTWSTSTTASIYSDYNYRVMVDRDTASNRLTMTLYDYYDDRTDEIRPEDQLQRIHHTLNYPYKSYTKLMGFNYFSKAASGDWTGKAWDLSTASTNTQTVATTGYMILSPHTRIEIDLSAQPLGLDYICDEYIITELIRYWAYIKPVNKFISYNYLLAPLARADRTSPTVPTYDAEKYDGFLNTVFTGSFFTSGAGTSAGILASELDKTYIYVQSQTDDVWRITHSLGTSAVMVQVYNVDRILIRPLDIYPEDENTITLIWNTPVRGIAYVKKPDKSITQSTPASAWTIYHNLGTSGATSVVSEYYSSENPTITVFSPSGVREIDSNTLYATWGLTPLSVPEVETGISIIENSDYTHTQTTASTTWTIQHNLAAAGVLVQAYENETDLIWPDSIEIISNNKVTLTFNTAVTGKAAVIGIPEDVELATGTGDPTGLDIFPKYGSKGYWETGDGTLADYDYTSNNRLQNTTATGNFLSITEVGDYYFLEFEIPSTYELESITEIGVFNNVGVLQFYTNCSPIYKPEGVSMRVHYRIEKDGVTFV